MSSFRPNPSQVPVSAGGEATGTAHLPRVEITLSTDRLEAKARVIGLIPPSDVELRRALNEAGIVFGLFEATVMQLCRLPLVVHPMLIARGRPAAAGIPPWIEYFFIRPDDNRPFTPGRDGDGRVDFKEGKLIERAEVGTVLARRNPGTRGTPGKDVLGADQLPPVEPEPPLVPGRGTKLSESRREVLATISGAPTFVNGNVEILPICLLRSVNLASGNVFHLGAVKISGDVLPGFSIVATGDIEVDGIVEGAIIICGGNVVIRGGVRNQTRIDAAGSISVRFVDSSSELYAQGDIVVLVNAVQCNLDAGQSVKVLGRRAGGETRAGSSVTVGELGTPSGTPTVVIVGHERLTDETRRDSKTELSGMQASLGILCADLRVLDDRSGHGAQTPQLKKMIARRAEITIEIQRLQAKLATAELLESVGSAPIPQVSCGTALPGSVITTGKNTYQVTQPEFNPTYQPVEIEGTDAGELEPSSPVATLDSQRNPSARVVAPQAGVPSSRRPQGIIPLQSAAKPKTLRKWDIASATHISIKPGGGK